MYSCQREFLGVGGKTAMDVARDQETRDVILNRGSIFLHLSPNLTRYLDRIIDLGCLFDNQK